MVSLNKALTAAAAMAAPPLVEFKTILGRSVEISYSRLKCGTKKIIIQN